MALLEEDWLSQMLDAQGAPGVLPAPHLRRGLPGVAPAAHYETPPNLRKGDAKSA